jgi:hypothetical protein
LFLLLIYLKFKPKVPVIIEQNGRRCENTKVPVIIEQNGRRCENTKVPVVIEQDEGLKIPKSL